MSKSDKTKIKPEVASSAEVLNKILDSIRPALARDGGSLELVSYDQTQGLVEISFVGACAHCPVSDVTLKQLIESEIRSQMPGIKEVRSV